MLDGADRRSFVATRGMTVAVPSAALEPLRPCAARVVGTRSTRGSERERARRPLSVESARRARDFKRRGCRGWPRVGRSVADRSALTFQVDDVADRVVAERPVGDDHPWIWAASLQYASFTPSIFNVPPRRLSLVVSAFHMAAIRFTRFRPPGNAAALRRMSSRYWP